MLRHVLTTILLAATLLCTSAPTMAYFDATTSNDRNLLHDTVRSHPEMNRVAEQAEYDVIESFVVGYGSSREVMLEGFETESTQAAGDVREALRKTVADVVSHRLRYYDYEAPVRQESRGRKQTTYEAGFDPLWPKAWDYRLVRYDTRPALY